MTTFTAWAWLGIGWTVATAAAAETTPVEPPEAVARVAAWASQSGDSRGLPFVVIDKVTAQVFVFGADGQLSDATPALLGSALGDDSVPGIGDRPLAQIKPEERTTPAGRFLAGFGPGPKNRQVLWVDYETAVSMHPVVNANRKEQRPERLQSETPDDNRITYGCINISAKFYEDVVRPMFTEAKAVVYVLPETRTLAEVFPRLPTQALAEAPEDAEAVDLAVVSPTK